MPRYLRALDFRMHELWLDGALRDPISSGTDVFRGRLHLCEHKLPGANGGDNSTQPIISIIAEVGYR